jgi:hypothetical protein
VKILFAGPSLHGTPWAADEPSLIDGVECRGPAAQGDIATAVVEGATAIGLIDGRFEDIAAVWHKEILYALEEGVQVFGAASMGALRAAECAPFGMIGVGAVFERYRDGDLVDDAAVAQTHAPAELGYAPLSEALVNVEATLERFVKLRAINEAEAAALNAGARRLFFKERTWPQILDAAGLDCEPRRARLLELVRRCRVDVKQQDAVILAKYLSYLDPARQAAPDDWRMESSYTWVRTLERVRGVFPGLLTGQSVEPDLSRR